MNQLQLQDVPLDSQHHRCRRHKPMVDRHALRAKCGIGLGIRRAVNIKIEVAWRRMLIMRRNEFPKSNLARTARRLATVAPDGWATVPNNLAGVSGISQAKK